MAYAMFRSRNERSHVALTPARRLQPGLLAAWMAMCSAGTPEHLWMWDFIAEQRRRETEAA